MSEAEKAKAVAEWKSRQENIVIERRHRYSTSDLDCIGSIGTGAFGVVSLVICKRTGGKYALKQIRKDGMSKKNHRERVLAEKALLSELQTSWVVTLHRTFQDANNLYMLMEYLPGGDLMSHLIRLDSFTEYQTKFYTAELVEAVHAIHRLGFIHRDIKPDNIVLTADGHLKLIDFGLCKFSPSIKMDALASDDRVVRASSLGRFSAPSVTRLAHWNRVQLRSTVGTPQYMAPEVLNKAYDQASDFWSVGVIAYECLMGGTPFYDETAEARGGKPDIKRILHKVVNYKEYLPIPFPGKQISAEAVSFLKSVLCEAQLRMRYDQILAHPFFQGLPLHNMRALRAPIQPGEVKLLGPTVSLPPAEPGGMAKDRNLQFVGYTYNRQLV